MIMDGVASPRRATNGPQCVKRIRDGGLSYRRSEESALRRNLAAGWIKEMLDNVDIPSEPSNEEFLHMLRSGVILCKLINKVQPGIVSKIIDNYIPTTQSCQAYHYFENMGNFLKAVDELKLPTFQASDLQEGSLQSSTMTKIVDCILGLKSHHDGTFIGGKGSSSKYARSPFLSSPLVGRLSEVSPPESDKNKNNCKQLDLDLANSVLREVITEDPDQVANKYYKPETLNSHTDTKEAIGKHANQSSAKSKENIENIYLTPQQNDSMSQDHPDRLLSNVTSKCYNTDGTKDVCQHKLSKASGEILLQQQNKLIELKSLHENNKADIQEFILQYERDLLTINEVVREFLKPVEEAKTLREENRKLYNAIQDLKGNIRVYCRVRPLFSNQSNVQSAITYTGEEGSLIVSGPKTGKDTQKLFNFNKVFDHTATQEDVYKDTQPLIRSVMDGYNVCIFAYGQTGSGKTHTMSGPNIPSERDLGVNYRALSDLFEISQARQEIMSYEVSVQMIEIYMEQVRDLLCQDNSSNKNLGIRNGHMNNGFSVPEAVVMPVNSPANVLELMDRGFKNRTVSSTALNDRSSRSHSILTVHVQGKNMVSGGKIHSCLHLIDLAGSERAEKSEVQGDRFKEAVNINRSLSALGDVIYALSQKNAHVPYRNSKLTQLLQDSLGGQAKALMLVHVNPELDSYGETISTLKFAERVANVELGAARVNKESGEVLELKQQVENLKKALVKKDAEITQLQNTRLSPSMFEKSRFRAEPGSKPRRSSLEGVYLNSRFGFDNQPLASQGDDVSAMGIEDRISKASVPSSSNRRSSLGYGNFRPPKTPEKKTGTSAGTDSFVSSTASTEKDCMSVTKAPQTTSRHSTAFRGLQKGFGKILTLNGGEKKTAPVDSPTSTNANTSTDRRLSLQPGISRRQSITPVAAPAGRENRRSSLTKGVEPRPSGINGHAPSANGHAEKGTKRRI